MAIRPLVTAEAPPVGIWRLIRRFAIRLTAGLIPSLHHASTFNETGDEEKPWSGIEDNKRDLR
jgi:hypothetical protein